MSEEWPPRISFWRRPALIGLTFLHPTQATRECISYVRSDTGGFYGKSIRQIRRGFAEALGWVTVMFLLGGGIGHGLAEVYGKSERGAVVVGALGGLILLWATLAVQGWSIQSLDGDTPPEQINQWLYRGLSLCGTLLAVIAASWSYFAPGP